MILWEAAAQAGGQTLRALRRRRRRERGRAGGAGNVPTVHPWAAACRIRPYLCCRRAWGRGRVAGAGPWGSSGCPSGATELTGPWSLRLNGCSALWSGHRSGMLLLEHLQGWNVGAPIVLSHSQECWGSPCPAPPHTPPKQLCQLLVGRERMNHRVGIRENPEI